MAGGGNTTTTTKSDPPAYLQPYLTRGAELAGGIYDNNGAKQFYPGQTFAPRSFETNAALSSTANRAFEGSGAVKAGQNFIQQGLGGPATPAYQANSNLFGSASNPFANQANPYGAATNPYLDATFNKAALSTQNQLASEFARSGRNVGASEGLRSQQLNDLATNIYGGAYENERNRGLGYDQQLLGIGATGYENERARMAAEQGQNQSINANAAENAAQRQQGLLGYGIPYANQDYADLQQLASVGKANEAYTQQGIDDSVARFNFAQDAPGNAVDDYIRRVTGFMGGYGTQTQTAPSNRNPVAGAMGGAALGSMLGPWGALGGGLLGGIFG